MKLSNYAKIQRQLGYIEGVAETVSGASGIFDAIETIDSILSEEVGEEESGRESEFPSYPGGYTGTSDGASDGTGNCF